MDAPVTFTSFTWTRYGTDDYFYAIENINDIYRKMPTIGEVNKVFCDTMCLLMTAKTKKEFQCERKKNFRGSICTTPKNGNREPL